MLLSTMKNSLNAIEFQYLKVLQGAIIFKLQLVRAFKK